MATFGRHVRQALKMIALPPSLIGWIQVRWQGVPPQADSRNLLRSVRLVKLADLDSSVAKDLPRVTAAQRSAELEERRSQWLLRTAAARPGDSGKSAR